MQVYRLYCRVPAGQGLPALPPVQRRRCWQQQLWHSSCSRCACGRMRRRRQQMSTTCGPRPGAAALQQHKVMQAAAAAAAAGSSSRRGAAVSGFKGQANSWALFARNIWVVGCMVGQCCHTPPLEGWGRCESNALWHVYVLEYQSLARWL